MSDGLQEDLQSWMLGKCERSNLHHGSRACGALSSSQSLQHFHSLCAEDGCNTAFANRFQTFACDVQEDLQSWMLDKRARDQFVVRSGDATEVMWNDPQRLGAESVRPQPAWT